MTEQSIYDELDAVPSVLAIHVKDGKKFNHYDERIFQYITKNGDTGRAESFTVIVHDQGGLNEEYLWMNGKPSILQDNTIRGYHMTDQEIKDDIGTKKSSEVLKLTKRIDGDLDYIRVTLSDGTLVDDLNFVCYMKNGETKLEEIKQ